MQSLFRLIILTALAANFLVMLSSCKKEGTGGKASLTGYVRHHGIAIPDAAVYIKFGAKEFPGTDISSYDDQVMADAAGMYTFSSLYKGDYYLYAVGYDNAGMYTVIGGVGIDISRNKSYSLDVPVTE